MAVLAGEVKVGNIIAYEGGKYRILKRTYVKPDRGEAFYLMEMKEISVGTMRNERIRSDDKLEKLETSARDFTFAYRDGNTIVIMDDETFENNDIPVEILNKFDMFLEEGMKLIAEYLGGVLVNVKMPQKLVGEVGETEPLIKNSLVGPSYKEAKLTNGFVLDIPPYIEQGTKIVVSSETGEFIEKFQ